MMVFMSLLPTGVIQAFASIDHGLWFARSPEVIHSPAVQTLVWLRVPGDIVFGAGAFTLAAFAARLVVGGGGAKRAESAGALPAAAE
jgi:nitric oxide reductase subunit B